MTLQMPILLLLVSTVTAKPVEPDPTAQRWRDFASRPEALQPGRNFPYQACFRAAADRHGLPLTLLLAVARGESDFDPKAVSSADAMGLMQIRWPGTAHHLGVASKAQLFDPCTNVDAGARYLQELSQRYRGDLHRTLAAYNYGPGRIDPGTSSMPPGARWYSGYILRHLDYVTGKQGGRPAGAYRDEGRLALIRFTRPYRATALMHSLLQSGPELRLDVFRHPTGDYQVVLLFADRRERRRSLRRLAALGIQPMDP